MINNVVRATAAIALLVAAPSMAFAKSATLLTTDDLASFCDQGSARGDTEALLDVGGGNAVAITVHCGAAGMKLSSNADNESESESGPSETAEHGVED